MSEQSNFDDINQELDEALTMCAGSEDAARRGALGCTTANGALGEYMLRIDAIKEGQVDDLYDRTADILGGSSGASTTSDEVYAILEQVTQGSGRADHVLEPANELRQKARGLRTEVDNDYTHHKAAIDTALQGVIDALKAYVTSNDERRLEFEDFGLQAQVVAEAIRLFRAGS